MAETKDGGPEMRPIPVSAAKRVADEFGYDQVIIVARKVGTNGGEHCTTYGVNREHCDVAARCGDFLKHEVMGWHREQTADCGNDLAVREGQGDQHGL